MNTPATATGTSIDNGLVEVTAPLTLKEGFPLQVVVNGQMATVIVPAGGVEEGQVFRAPVAPEAVVTADGATAGPNIPSGHWRDGLCDCFKFGPCHAMCWMGFCFEPVLVGQVMTRMSRNWCGGEGQRPSASKTCAIVTSIFVLFMVADAVLTVVADTQVCMGGRETYDTTTDTYLILCPDGTTQEPNSLYKKLTMAASILSFLFALYVLIASMRTRGYIRQKYNIPAKCCGGLEDCCCVFFCHCCTAQQMARHTHDYEKDPVTCCSNSCCSKRGQPVHVPEIV